MKNFKKILCLITAVVLVFSLAACGEKTETNEEKVDNPAVGKNTVVENAETEMKNFDPDVLAEMNGEELRKEDIEPVLKMLTYVYSLNGQEVDEETMLFYAVQYEITSTIYENKLKEYGLTINDEDVQKQLETLASEFEGGMEELEKGAADAGVSVDDLKKVVRSDLVYAAVEEHLTKDINITDEDCKKFFDENPDQFITKPTRDFHQITYDTEEEAKMAIEAIQKGTSFQSFVDSRNEAVGNNENGNMVTVSDGDLAEIFNDIAFSLASGQVYESPIKSEKGYHVIMVDNFMESETLQYENILEELREFLKASKSEEVLTEMFDTAWEELGITINPQINPSMTTPQVVTE